MPDGLADRAARHRRTVVAMMRDRTARARPHEEPLGSPPAPAHVAGRPSRRRRPGRPLAHHRAHGRAGAARVGRRRRVRGPRVDVRRCTATCPSRRSSVVDGDAALEIVTDRLRLVYDRGPFSPAGLSVQVARQRQRTTAACGATASPSRDLGGTARTLDDVDGRVPLEPGRRVALRASPCSTTRGSFVFEDDGWVSPRDGRTASTSTCSPTATTTPSALQALLRRLRAAAGAAALGARQLVEPLPRATAPTATSSCWTASTPRACRSRSRCSTWTGTGSTSVPAAVRLGLDRLQLGAATLFPDPEGFLAELHRRGLRVTLNVHPADGVRAFEDAYPAMAEALGRDPASERADRRSTSPTARSSRPTSRSCTTRSRTRASTSGGSTGSRARTRASPGIDPLWMLNHFHFLDSGRDGRRPLTFSRYAGPGSHRYPVGFSGDTIISWASLRLPARVHRDRVEHRLRLVEPRHRRPHLRRARRRARRPAGCSSACSRRSCACTRRATRSSSRSRGCIPREARDAMGDGAALPPPARARTCTR